MNRRPLAEGERNSMLFSQKLDAILKKSDASIVGWMTPAERQAAVAGAANFPKHDDAFIVRDKTRFEAEIMPRYLSSRKLESFSRSLNGWGFTKQRKQKGRHIWTHTTLRRGLDVKVLLKRVAAKKVDASAVRVAAAAAARAAAAAAATPPVRHIAHARFGAAATASAAATAAAAQELVAMASGVSNILHGGSDPTASRERTSTAAHAAETQGYTVPWDVGAEWSALESDPSYPIFHVALLMREQMRRTVHVVTTFLSLQRAATIALRSTEERTAQRLAAQQREIDELRRALSHAPSPGRRGDSGGSGGGSSSGGGGDTASSSSSGGGKDAASARRSRAQDDSSAERASKRARASASKGALLLPHSNSFALTPGRQGSNTSSMSDPGYMSYMQLLDDADFLSGDEELEVELDFF